MPDTSVHNGRCTRNELLIQKYCHVAGARIFACISECGLHAHVSGCECVLCFITNTSLAICVAQRPLNEIAIERTRETGATKRWLNYHSAGARACQSGQTRQEGCVCVHIALSKGLRLAACECSIRNSTWPLSLSVSQTRSLEVWVVSPVCAT